MSDQNDADFLLTQKKLLNAGLTQSERSAIINA